MSKYFISKYFLISSDYLDDSLEIQKFTPKVINKEIINLYDFWELSQKKLQTYLKNNLNYFYKENHKNY